MHFPHNVSLVRIGVCVCACSAWYLRNFSRPNISPFKKSVVKQLLFKYFFINKSDSLLYLCIVCEILRWDIVWCSSVDRFTPHRPLSSAGSIPSSASSFPLFTPAAVPASYFSAIRPPFPGLDATNVPNPFHGVPSRNGLFAPPSVGLHPSLMSSSLMMGLPNQFGSQDALLGASK